MEWWAVGLFLTLAVWAMLAGGIGSSTDNLLYDLSLRSNGARVRPDIALVTIDNSSLDKFGSWPWPRGKQADLIAAIARNHPASISVNLLFVEDRDEEEDDRLAKTIAGAGVPVYLAMAIENPLDGESQGRPRTLLPREALQAAAAGLGHTSLIVDPDGQVRRVWLDIRAGGQHWPALGLVAAGLPRGLAADADASAPTMIAFAARGRFSSISAWQLLDSAPGHNDAGAGLAGKHVIVGVTAPGIESAFPTPLSGRSGLASGSEIQAQLLSSLLDGRAIRPLAPGWLPFAAVLPLWLMLVLLRQATPGAAALYGALLLTLYLALARIAVVRFGIWVPQTAGIVGLLMVYPFWAWRRLSVIMAYMTGELAGFEQEFPITAGQEPAVLGDPLIGRAALLAWAIDQAEALRHFAVQTIQHLPSPTLIADADGAVTSTNSAARSLFASLGAGEPQGAGIETLLRHFRLARDARDAPEGDLGSGPNWPLNLVTSDQREFELVLSVLRDGGDKPYAWILQLSDITAVKAAVRQREAVLQLLTHDIRSPMISTLALLDRADRQGEVDLARLRGHSERVLGLADDFVMLAKARGANYRFEPVSLRLLLEDAIEEIRPQAEMLGMDLTLTGLRDPWLVRADQDLIQRSLVNLLGNALKHARSGGRIVCLVEQEEASMAHGCQVIVRIRDWGEGIPPERIATVFEPFSQVPGGNAGLGAGLGLAFVATVMRGHGGKASCENMPDGGCCFTLRFAALNDDAESDGEPGQDQSGHAA